jgi:hypothetical protein
MPDLIDFQSSEAAMGGSLFDHDGAGEAVRLSRSRNAAPRTAARTRMRERTPRGGKEVTMVPSSASCGRPLRALRDSNLCRGSD